MLNVAGKAGFQWSRVLAGLCVLIVNFLMLSESNAESPCTPTKKNPVCVYYDASIMTVRMLLQDPKTDCMTMRFRGPKDHVDGTTYLRSRFPITEWRTYAREKGYYQFNITYDYKYGVMLNCPWQNRYLLGIVQYSLK